MMSSITGLDGSQELLIKLLEQNPDDWGMRKKVVWFLYEAGYFREAAKVIWNAPEIPPVDKEIVFALRIVSKGQPTRSMRLLTAVLEQNRAEPQKNIEMAKELMRGGLPLQAIRFYGAATLSDSSLIDEEFEVALITTDAEEEDWTESVHTEGFPWDAPVELTESDLAIDSQDEEETVDSMLAGVTQPVPLKTRVKSLEETMTEDEKVTDLRVEKSPLSFKPDQISTEAVTAAIKLTSKPKEEAKKESEKEPKEEPKEEAKKRIETSDIKVKEDASEEEKVVEFKIEDSFAIVEEPEFVPAKKRGILSCLFGFFKKSKPAKEEQSDADIFGAPDAHLNDIESEISSLKPSIKNAKESSPVMGPVKPKRIAASEKSSKNVVHRAQPEALDCRTRLVALAPQDGTEYFNMLKEKYALASNYPDTVKIAREAGDVDYLDLIEKACSGDKSVNLDSFSQLLGLYSIMIEADCDVWVDDMNLLRQGYGDAVLATVVSKYSVSECRDILGAVYRKTATQEAV